MVDSDRTTRRTVLHGLAAGAVTVGLAGCGGNGGNGGQDTPPGYEGFLDETDDYDGVVDETGSGEVTVQVGTEANGGNFGFDPVAIEVDAGTTVVWEWTGEGQQHNVVAEDGSFESDLTAEAGHTFSYTFEEAGTWKYACTPHRAVGMRGVVEVA